MTSSHTPQSHTPYFCLICEKEFTREHLFPLTVMNPRDLFTLIGLQEHTNVPGFLCYDDLKKQISRTLVESTTVSSLTKDTLKQRSFNVRSPFLSEGGLTLGERLADKVADFGGSWKFILSFFGLMILWIGINSWTLFTSPPFDPYPYIFLNLVLSCLSAIQAPIIMMSQNRQETRDRIHAENDFQINLKAEAEIRNIAIKLDHHMKFCLEIFQKIEKPEN